MVTQRDLESSNISVQIDIPGGWNAANASYDAAQRLSGPWAMLDVIYQAQLLILSADPDAQFPISAINWSPRNTVEIGSITPGQIGTSFYNTSTNEIFILGAQDVDTDEFDRHIIAHEYGHYVEDNFARSDSFGGSHGIGDVLDETVAMSEGWANAFACMVLNDPVYIDTGDISQSAVILSFDADADTIADDELHPVASNRLLDGAWAQTSVHEILFDIFDNNIDDEVSLGFGTIFSALVGPQQRTPGFTSMYSFLTGLKAALPGAEQDAIDALAAAENISGYDQYEMSSDPRYTLLSANDQIISVGINGQALQITNEFGSYNKFENRQFFRVVDFAGFRVPVNVEVNGFSEIQILRPGDFLARATFLAA